jgi:hypothetical protein
VTCTTVRLESHCSLRLREVDLVVSIEKLNLFPYKVTAVLELKPADYERRIHYCEWLKNFIQTKTIDILDVTFFTHEAWLHLLGYFNTQNTLLWSSENP